MKERIGFAGSFDSNDCLVTVKESKDTQIKIDSIVSDYFYDDILSCVKNAITESGVKNISVEIQDKGALDFTIRARVLTAIKRFMEEA